MEQHIANGESFKEPATFVEEKFTRMCGMGNLDGIKELMKTNIINIHAKDDGSASGFKYACFNGHLNIIKFLANLYKTDANYTMIDIHHNMEEAFARACEGNQLKVVKYLINLYKRNPDYCRS